MKKNKFILIIILICSQFLFFSFSFGDVLKIGFDGLTASIISVDIRNHSSIVKIESEGFIGINKGKLQISSKLLTFDLDYENK